jgi:hypothetical protein
MIPTLCDKNVGGLTVKMINPRFRFGWRRACAMLLTAVLATPGVLHAAPAGEDYRVTNPALRLVPIDTDKTESFLSMALDGSGRLFVGAREGLFVYEPRPGGLYRPRQELYRFPKDSCSTSSAMAS